MYCEGCEFRHADNKMCERRNCTVIDCASHQESKILERGNCGEKLKGRVSLRGAADGCMRSCTRRKSRSSSVK